MTSSPQSSARSAGPRSASAEPSEPTKSEGHAPSPLARPEQFGRYRLCFELASGGMATVYLAHAGGPGRFQKYVALKRIHAHLASRRDFVEMFHDEAAIAARISHPNVAAVFDFGEENGVHYLAMEYLVGEPLIRLLRACRKQPAIDWSAHARIIARVIADVCEGLHAAHELTDEQGEPLDVVHRDVSPDNVFVTYDGVVKLVDFGVASARNRITHTTTGVLKGKHSYMAPELLSEDGFDRRADIFSAGVVLWEALTLRRLFRRESEAKTLFAVLGDPIPRPSEKVPDLDPALDAIVMRALARDPAERYPTARELARDLRGWLLDQRADVTAADIEAWAAALCPDGLAQRRALLASVDRIVAEAEAIPVEVVEEEPTRVDPTTTPAPSPRAPRRTSWIAAAVLGVLGGLGGLAWALHDPASEPSGAARESAAERAGADDATRAAVEASDGEGGSRAIDGEAHEGATAEAPARAATSAGSEGGAALEHAAHRESEPAAATEGAAREGAARAPTDEAATERAERAATTEGAAHEGAARAPTDEGAAAARDSSRRGDTSAARAASPPRRRARTSAAPDGPPGELRIGLRARGGGSLPDDAWAEVRIDGRAVDGSPPLRVRVPPGRHLVEVRAYGTGRRLTRMVDVEPGGRAIAIFEIEGR